jgi:hypothetical protein
VSPKIVVCKPMSATAFPSIMCTSRISGTGEQEIKKHLSAHLGPGFCPTQQSVSMLSEGHAVVHYHTTVLTSPTKVKSRQCLLNGLRNT